MLRKFLVLVYTLILSGFQLFSGCASVDKNPDSNLKEIVITSDPVLFGNEVLIKENLEKLKGLNVGLVVHGLSLVNGVFLPDTLIHSGINVKKLFSPEHGLRGQAEAGGKISDDIDSKTGLPIVSLYGSKNKPSNEDLKGLDIIIFDLQDVGSRFYTYLSTLHYVMEACAEEGVKVWVLDRPNPSIHCIGGPVLKQEVKSFVGMHAVPIQYGMTIGEYAKMINGEGWLAEKQKCDLTIIKMSGYQRSMKWEGTNHPWLAPSPNLPTLESAENYPYLCWYEGTQTSVGRGTDKPFEQIGFPGHRGFLKSFRLDSIEGETSFFPLSGWELMPTKFKPVPIKGKSEHPIFENKDCYGLKINHLGNNPDSNWLAAIQLLYNFESEYSNIVGSGFFNSFFDKLSGNTQLKNQIHSGESAEKIVLSWQPDLNRFKRIREKYLIYP